MSQILPQNSSHTRTEASMQPSVPSPAAGTQRLNTAALIEQATTSFAHSALATQIYDRSGTLVWMNEAHRALFGLPDLHHGVGTFNLLSDALMRSSGHANSYAQALAGNIMQVTVPLRQSEQDAHNSNSPHLPTLTQDLLPLRADNGDMVAMLVLSSDTAAKAHASTNTERLYRSVERRARARKTDLEAILMPLQQEAAASHRILALIADDEFQELQRTESLGLLARNIAHDFNNLLTRIQGNADLALMSIEDEAPDLAQEHLVQICSAVNQAAQLTSQILTYTRRDRYTNTLINLNDVSMGISELIHHLRRYQCQIYLNLAKDLPLVQINSIQARQVVLNLLFNAAEALDHGIGTITLTTGHCALSQADLQPLILGAAATPGKFAQISITDTGCGIHAEHIPQIFNPFFSTRLRGRGLGLTAVHSIIREHGGAMRVTSAPDNGTTFEVWLPLSNN